MRKVISGAGVDVTATVAAFLNAGNQFNMADLFLIGDVEHPQAQFLTDWEAPLSWPVIGTFHAAAVERGSVSTKIGLEVGTLEVTWSPATAAFTNNTQTANPLQLARMGFYRGWKLRVWSCYLPVPGDANTYGASELFGGRIMKSTVERGKITFSVQSFLDQINQNFPSNVIEFTNTLAAYQGATPPAGQASVPRFSTIVGSTQTKLYLRETSPTADTIFADNLLRNGFVVFDSGGSQTLGGIWSPIYANKRVTISGSDYNEVVLYTPLPWAPTTGTDTCIVSAAFPIAQADGQFLGFPYVPAPSTSI